MSDAPGHDVADVAIIGAGVAGCAIALSLLGLDTSLRVALIERRVPGRMRVGETLVPHANRLLERLGLAREFASLHALPAHGTSAAWEAPQLHHNAFLFTGQGDGWQLDRALFDAWLATQARARGATLSTGVRVTRLEREPSEASSWRLDLDDGATMHARFLIDASGRGSVVARKLDATRRIDDRLVAVWRFFDRDPPRLDGRTMVEAMPYGWWYSTGLPDGGSIVALMTDADLVGNLRARAPDGWDALLGGTCHSVARLGDARARHSPRIADARSQSISPVCGEGWLAVGDAAACFDPLSSLGIFKALRSGILGSYAALDHLRGVPGGLEKYARVSALELDGYRLRHREVYGAVRRFADQPFWRRRLGAAAGA